MRLIGAQGAPGKRPAIHQKAIGQNDVECLGNRGIDRARRSQPGGPSKQGPESHVKDCKTQIVETTYQEIRCFGLEQGGSRVQIVHGRGSVPMMAAGRRNIAGVDRLVTTADQSPMAVRANPWRRGVVAPLSNSGEGLSASGSGSR